MNRLEFNEVRKAMDINNPLSTTTGRYGSREDVHYWNNLAIWFGGSYYTIIKGKIPLELARMIYEKYPGNPHKIRVNGGASDWNPIDRAEDEEYEREIKEFMEEKHSIKEFKVKCKEAHKRLQKRPETNKYIKGYHIDTKEGLLLSLIELRDYYLRKNNITDQEGESYEELIAKINSELLRKITPGITASEWMQDDEENKDKYNEVIERDYETESTEKFREAINDFDKAVNPFINDDIELDDIYYTIQKVKITASPYNHRDGKDRENCCELKITDLETGNSTTYYRSPNGFSFQLQYKLDDNNYLSVLHYYSVLGDNEEDKGEVIAFCYYGNDNENLDIRYNLTNQTIEKRYGVKKNITPEQIEFVYRELLKAIKYASRITVENMQKKDNTKKLVK